MIHQNKKTYDFMMYILILYDWLHILCVVASFYRILHKIGKNIAFFDVNYLLHINYGTNHKNKYIHHQNSCFLIILVYHMLYNSYISYLSPHLEIVNFGDLF